MAEVVVISPVRRNFMVNFARALVINLLRITVVASRTEHRLPYVKLVAGAAFRTQHQFVAIVLFHRGEHQPVGFAGSRTFHASVRPLNEISMLVIVQISSDVRAKVHHVGTEDPSAVVKIRVENLRAQRLPSSGRAAEYRPCPPLAYGTKLLLDVWNQLLRDRVAIRSQVGRVHRVRVIEVRIRMLDLQDDYSRQSSRRPILKELVTILRGQLRLWIFDPRRRWLRAKRRELRDVAMKMGLLHYQRISRIGMLLPPFRQQHDSA